MRGLAYNASVGIEVVAWLTETMRCNVTASLLRCWVEPDDANDQSEISTRRQANIKHSAIASY